YEIFTWLEFRRVLFRSVVLVKGTANWDNAFDTLIDSFKALSTMLDKQGVKPAGNGMIVYTSTDDNGFTFLAEMPIEQEPKTLGRSEERRVGNEGTSWRT